MPAYMVKGKCRRNLLSQFTVQRETRREDDDDGVSTIRWFYRLLWNGGNVAYHDYMKTVLTKEEIESILPLNASAEYIGDIFEFWLGTLELGIQFPTMFRDGERTSTVALLDLKNLSGYSAVLVATPRPSTQNVIDQGKPTSLRSRTRWWWQS